MSIQEVQAEQFAELYYHYQQALKPALGCTNHSTPDSWNDLPSEERNRSVAAARLALLDLAAAIKERKVSKCYFATPGEAEWGC